MAGVGGKLPSSNTSNLIKLIQSSTLFRDTEAPVSEIPKLDVSVLVVSRLMKICNIKNGYFFGFHIWKLRTVRERIPKTQRKGGMLRFLSSNFLIFQRKEVNFFLQICTHLCFVERHREAAGRRNIRSAES